MDQYERALEYNISSLVEQQFPAFYRDQGPAFVQFVKEYYKWMEGSQDVADKSFVIRGHVHVSAKSANVSGDGTDFTRFSPGDTIAIYHQDSVTDYELFTVNSVSNNTFLTLSGDLPGFSSSNSAYATVKKQYNPNYYLRRYMDLKDIDNTTDEFLVYFKEKYLKNIKFDTQSNMKTLMKHSLDLYRSKGTERAIDLLFRSVFGQPAEIYYPGNDIFRLSDGKWYQPVYLEISLKEKSDKLVGKQIVGLSSGATAFAEALVRRTVKGRIIDVLYISAVNGDFETDEQINTADGILELNDRPAIVGSLSSIDVSDAGSGANYKVGDIVTLYSDHGEQGKARVTSVTDATGLVTFTLENGGYGYSPTDTQVLVSEKILVVANVQVSPSNITNRYTYMFDYATQPLANVNYDSGTGQFANGDMVYAYNGTTLNGTGRVMKSMPSNATHGYFIAEILTGNLDQPKYYSTSNTFNVSRVSVANATAVGNVIGYYSNVIIDVTSSSGTFAVNEQIYQLNDSGIEVANGVLTIYNTTGPSTGTARIRDLNGVFVKGKRLIGRNSNASANVENTTLYVGVKSIVNTFYTSNGNYITFSNSGSNGVITAISNGSLANVTYSNNLIYTETVEMANDYVRDYLTVPLNAATYGFPKDPAANLTSNTINNILGLIAAYQVGKIYQLTGINKGTGYNLAPIVKAFNPVAAQMGVRDMELRITGPTKDFVTGEIITQVTPNSRGIVKSSNSSYIKVELLRMLANAHFVPTANANSQITGSLSGAVANVSQVFYDPSTEYLGLNAVIDAEALTVAGAVNGLEPIASGFGYKQGDSLRVVREGLPEGHEDAAFALGNLEKQGVGEGYYKRKTGWLSDSSKLFDGYYYQEYSYEIRASVMLNKYETMLKQLLHVAGTKYFSAYVYPTSFNAGSNFVGSTITQG